MPPVHRPSHCIICFVQVEAATKNQQQLCNPFPSLCKSFNLKMLVKKCNVKAKTRVQFCDNCQDMLNEIDDTEREIDLLQNKINHLKTKLQSKVYTSRILWKEKDRDKRVEKNNDHFVEMIRDMLCGIFVRLPRLTTEQWIKQKRKGEQETTESSALIGQSSTPIKEGEELELVGHSLHHQSGVLVDNESFFVVKNLEKQQQPHDPASDFVIPACDLEKLCFTSPNMPQSFNNIDDTVHNSDRVEDTTHLTDQDHVDHMDEETLWSHHDNDDANDPDYILLPEDVDPPKKRIHKWKLQLSEEDLFAAPCGEDNSTAHCKLNNHSVTAKMKKKATAKSENSKTTKTRVRKTAASEAKPPRDKLKVDITPDGKILYKGFEILQVEGGFRCSICLDKKLFKLRISAVLHIMKNHMDCKKFQCELCCKQFLHLSNLKNHQKVHSTEKSLMCDICGRVFKLRETLLGHAKTHSQIQKPFGCKFCGKEFLHQRDCTVHTRTHTKERPYQCHVCPKSFIVLTLLNRHLQSHFRDEKT